MLNFALEKFISLNKVKFIYLDRFLFAPYLRKISCIR